MAGKKKSILRIGDGAGWHFVNGRWQDGQNDLLTVPEELRCSDGYGMQGHHYAFQRNLCYQDVRIRFEFRLTPLADLGIILRARDESHFYLLHFPNCGQASRAQNFWAAFSMMDESGYLKQIKMDLVRRVPSNINLWVADSNLWLPAEVALRGNKVSVRIGEHGYFEAEDKSYPGNGCIGVYSHSYRKDFYPDIRNVCVEGQHVTPSSWNDSTKQPTNWFHPCPESEYARYEPFQQPINLVKLDSGELLLTYVAVRGQKPAERQSEHLLTRSSDSGRSWSKPEAWEMTTGEIPWRPARLHLTPGGRLICFMKTEDEYLCSESNDEGRTWTTPVPAGIGPKPGRLKEMAFGSQAFLNLKDGSIVMFIHGEHDSTNPDLAIQTWGSRHCQGFACRSTDDGHSWSGPVNLDNPGYDKDGNPYDGSLDLTEVCAAQMSDGRIMALIRPIYSPWMWETWSSDGGTTWTPCVRGQFPGYAAPNMLRTSCGVVLVAHRLPDLTIHCSLDEGHTWDQGTLIDGSGMVMGAMVETEPDRVLYVYWSSFESLMRAQCIRVTADGLLPIRDHWASPPVPDLSDPLPSSGPAEVG